MTDIATTIRISELRQAIDRVLATAQQTQGNEIPLDQDHYWIIEPEDAFTLTTEPTLTIGQLTDDLDETTRLADPAHEVFLWHDIEHLVALLRYIGYRDRPR